ncbi:MULTISPECIES: restriction endonuclease subunit S [Bacillus amyloliquefaciens group]|uniref:restriction endonuclease subunit S n=1 Tax=Bacillus amyloliquefaciens group TaxID=1938374 RepID=UPI001AE599A1|nr:MULTISPECIES: restriction endonuclease subunit S [Bacillus amyloliquefaciens group]
MINYWISSKEIRNGIYIPKYYNPKIKEEIEKLSDTHTCLSVQELVNERIIEHSTGDEIGKHAYGTGNVPFVRTSDISNWEIKTIPKQGVARDIYEEYVEKQDVQEGDILLVRDGTYLIGHNCFISKVDKELIYQSHIIKIRVKKTDELEPELFFLLLNSDIVQKQIRSVQFTADIIDTIGQRFNEIIIPIPKSKELRKKLVEATKKAIKTRIFGKAFIKHCPKIVEDILLTGEMQAMEDYSKLSLDEIKELTTSDTVTLEFGGFNNFIMSSKDIRHNIYIPKYYDPTIEDELSNLQEKCTLISMGDLKKSKLIDYYTGDEIGKMAYGTGDIPFLRTSDFSNWEIKYNAKQGISEEIYDEYREKQDVQAEDILLVRDGTYLIGTSCIITDFNKKSLFCGGLYKIRSLDKQYLDPYLLLGLLNSYIVKRQIRTKQFTRDVIDTIGNRLDEVVLPIPKSKETRNSISEIIKETIISRILARQSITELASKATNKIKK